MSEILLSEVRKDNYSYRIDSEYQKKSYLKNIKIITTRKNGYDKLRNLIISMTGGATPLGANYEDNGVPFLRVQNIMNNYFNLQDIVYLSSKQSNEICRSILKHEDVLLTITGVSYGKSAVVYKELEGANINQHSVRIRVKKIINPYFLSTFLNSKYGKLQSDKNIVGMTRPALDYSAIKNFYIPKMSNNFQAIIEEHIKKSHVIEKISNDKYKRAEDLLLSELGLENFNPSNEKVSIKSLKESFLKTGRLDSEYYQPKYEVMEKKLDKIGVEKLESICSLINYGTVPTSPYVKNNNSVPYIKGMNLKNCFVVGELDEIENTDNLQDKFFTKENDIIISQMGTVGDVGIVTKEQENYLFASFTIRARLDDDRFNPFFVGAYIQNVAKEYYLYRNIAQASVRQNTDLPTIKNMPIPLVKKEVQDEIAGYIKQSMEYSKKAKELLEISTKAVEIAIDKDEQAAHNFLDRQTDSRIL